MGGPEDDHQHSRIGARRWLNVLLLLVTMALLVVFARHVDWASTVRALRRADLRLLALAVAFDLASIAVKGVRWGALLRAVGGGGMRPAIRDTVVGAALNNVVVANGGDAARVAIAARRSGVSSADVLATLAVERFTDAAVYIGLCGALALTVALPKPFAPWSAAAIVALAVTAALCALLLSRRVAPGTTPRSRHALGHRDLGDGHRSRMAGAVAAGVLRYSRRLATATASVAAGKRLATSLALSLLVWAGQWATFHLTARATALPISATASLLALLVVNASFVVRVTPGNVGVFQLMYVLAATATGLDRNRALAAGLLVQLAQYIPVTFIGLLLAPGFARGSRRQGRPPVAASDGAGTPAR